MAPSDFTRPKEGFRYVFGGIKTNSSPDSLPPDKYPMAINVRAYTGSSVRSRPGLSSLFQTGAPNKWTTDLRAYAALGTDDLPRLLARTADESIFLDTGTRVGGLAGIGASGASMIPFRPNQSPNPYMYIANGSDYQKFSAPVANVVTQQKVGIAEPQLPAHAYANPPVNGFIYVVHGTPTFVSAGTAGATSGVTRVSDTAQGNSIPDPDNPSGPSSVAVSAGKVYQSYMLLTLGGVSNVPIFDFMEALPITVSILSIYYLSGNTGRCFVVPNNLSSIFGVGGGASIFAETYIASLRHGSLIKIGTEVCYVIAVMSGPDGSIAIETSTTNTHTTADMLTGVSAFQFYGSMPNGTTLSGPAETFNVTAGIGTITATLANNPFVNAAFSLQNDDYIHLSVNVDNLANLNEMKLLIDVGDGSFTQNYYYYTIRPSDITAAGANTATQLAVAQTVQQRANIERSSATTESREGTVVRHGTTHPKRGAAPSGEQSVSGSSQWTEILIPITSLTRVGNDETLSLATATKFQILVNASGTVQVQISSIYTMGGFQPDVGDIGAPLLYRYRPRSSVTGAIGNPSPVVRYGVNPRRQSVNVFVPSARYDTQFDTWDIFRYGGSVTSWRFIGSMDASFGANNFTDNFGDDAAQAGDELGFDNFEPWPSVDIPINATATSVTGTTALVTIPSPTNALRFLPGNLVRIGGQNVYTLRVRPTLVTGTTYLFQFEENAGAGTNLPVAIYEPEIANQFLPYMWGPDVNGTIFAVGDPLRPGTLYFAKGNNPDSAPDSYNIEIVQPSEPLLGGEAIDGLSYVGSTERWWALYPTPDNPSQRYNFVQQPLPRGLAAPFGHCNDGVSLYWYAKDGIYSSSKGSLTDEDLFNLFPHEGVAGQDVTYAGQTVHAPDYSRAPQFRLTHSNGFLYAIYVDVGGVFRMLVLNLRTMAWSVDSYATPISAVYHVEQQPESGGTRNPVTLFAGRVSPTSTQGKIFQQADLVNDDTTPIACTLAVREYDGDDVRAQTQWGDIFIDLVPAAPAGVVLTPVSAGTGVVAPTTIPTAATRQRLPISMGGIVVSDFMGLLAQWSDDFSRQTVPTQLFIWQPSFDIQPAKSLGWTTFGTSFGLKGYGHIRQIAIAWVSTTPITIAITTVDGLSPQVLTIPSSGGQYQKQMFPISANKGQLFVFAASSAAPFQIFEDDIEIHVGAWGREGPYTVFKSFGGVQSSQSPV